MSMLYRRRAVCRTLMAMNPVRREAWHYGDHEGHEPPNMRIEIGLGGDDGYGVKVYC